MSRLVGGDTIEHSHAPAYATQTMNDATRRLAVGVPGGDTSVFARLVDCLEPPIVLLYVLHTPRGVGKPGRYRSPELDRPELRALLEKFSPLFAGDARHDVWAHAPDESATIVWDRHDLIYAYGPLERFAGVLRALGFQEGSPEIPLPHAHHYHAEFDSAAGDLLAALAWTHSPLRPEDAQ